MLCLTSHGGRGARWAGESERRAARADGADTPLENDGAADPPLFASSFLLMNKPDGELDVVGAAFGGWRSRGMCARRSPSLSPDLRPRV